MRALYVGSFDPFTNGHLEIIKQAEQLFDTVIVGVMDNSKKDRCFSAAICINAIQPYVSDKTDIRYCGNDLTTSVYKAYSCDYLIRGLRNTTDYLYEENLLKMYKELCPELKVLYLRAETEVSSSFVRELFRFKLDTSKYLPYSADQLDRMKVNWHDGKF